MVVAAAAACGRLADLLPAVRRSVWEQRRLQSEGRSMKDDAVLTINLRGGCFLFLLRKQVRKECTA